MAYAGVVQNLAFLSLFELENLNLYRSPSRHDSFVTTTECDECNNLYAYVEEDGFVWSTPFEGSVPLTTVSYIL